MTDATLTVTKISDRLYQATVYTYMTEAFYNITLDGVCKLRANRVTSSGDVRGVTYEVRDVESAIARIERLASRRGMRIAKYVYNG